MIQTVNNFVTWGEISKEAIRKLIEKRGKLLGNKKITGEYAKQNGYESLDNLVDSLYSCNVEYWKLPEIQKVFKLHPPSKGFKGKIKKGYNMGGELGYRGENINELLNRML
jgi:large subunit ribosomal protein L30